MHRVVVTDALDGYGAFTCDGGPDDECHQYPSCDCERWPCEHPSERQAACWITPWLNGDALASSYWDDDGYRSVYDEWHSGVITPVWDGEGVTWKYEDET